MPAPLSRAARFDINGRPAAAIGLSNIVEVLTEAGVEAVPCAPAHCRELLSWRGRWLPVFDLPLWYGEPANPAKAFLVIVEYETSDGADCDYGCFRVSEFPKITGLTDDDACPPLDDARWRRFAHSGFLSDGIAVPVLQLERVFRETAVLPEAEND